MKSTRNIAKEATMITADGDEAWSAPVLQSWVEQ